MPTLRTTLSETRQCRSPNPAADHAGAGRSRRMRSGRILAPGPDHGQPGRYFRVEDRHALTV